MRIDRSDYEIWFTDFLDGNLNEEQVRQLEQFLIVNPDLKEELEDLRREKIYPPTIPYSHKKSLVKNPSQVTDRQFDLLCAAYIENDLSGEALEEFELMISGDTERIKTLEQFSKTRLTPPDIKFHGKRKLLRLTPVQKSIRISAVSLSAAASVAALLFFLYTSSVDKSGNIETLSLLPENRPVTEQPLFKSPAETNRTDTETSPKLQAGNTGKTIINKLISADPVNESPEIISESVNMIRSNQESINPVETLPAYHIAGIAPDLNLNEALIRFNNNQPVSETDERTVAGFIAKTFREKILREEKADDSPIKGYEIAEAGVNGINKLLGWQMALVKNSDDKGEVKSVSFNSRLLKIQAPVNKHESSE